MRVSVLVSSLFFIHQASATVTARNFDWDNNIATLQTKIAIFDKTTGLAKELTTSEWALAKEQLGKPGPYENYVFLIDKIHSEKNSLKFYGDGPQGENFFLDQLLETLTTVTPAQWQGPVWDDFVSALSNPLSAREVTIITARSHDPANILAALKFLQEKGYIRYLPELAHIYPVSNPKLGGSAASPASTKAKIMLTLLDELNARALSEGPELDVLDADAQKRGLFHQWDYSDDDAKNIEKAFEVLSPEITKGRWKHVKITLTYTGPVGGLHGALSELAGSKKQVTFVMRSDGSARVAEANEIADFAKHECLTKLSIN